MDLHASIRRRKSCRKYDMQPLGQDVLNEIGAAIKGFASLSPGLPIEWRFTGQVKGRFHVDAPHYIVISGQGQAGEMENIGFVFEQLALWLDAMEIGCVWLGASKDAETADTKADIIVIGFGKTTEPVHRTVEQFKRKPIETITNDPEDVCVQAAHLAPSGMNTQPWYFEKQDGKTLVYEQKLRPPISLLYKHSDIDMGIALCHYAIACKALGKPFAFSREAALPAKAGYLSFGIIE